MLESSPHEVTVLLKAWSAGDESAREKLVQVVHRELHSMARRYMAGERSGHTLQPTALVNELYLQLVNTREMNWQNRAHFFAMCAQLMRRILTDFARSRRSLKRGGGAASIPLDESLFAGKDSPASFEALPATKDSSSGTGASPPPLFRERRERAKSVRMRRIS